jgi:hypothetical protein
MVWRGSGGNKIYNGIRPSLSYFENLGKANVLQSAVPIGFIHVTVWLRPMVRRMARSSVSKTCRSVIASKR